MPPDSPAPTKNTAVRIHRGRSNEPVLTEETIMAIRLTIISAPHNTPNRVINSSGETWYAVRLYSGLVGYIRGDLLRVDIQPVQVQAAEPEVIVRQSPGTGSNILVYVVVDPSLLQSGSEPQVIFVTPEQAAQMGIV